MHQRDVRLASNGCDERDVADEIEIQLLVERRVDCGIRADQQQRIAIGGCAYDRLCTDVAASTRPVLNDEGLAESLRQPLTHQTGQEVIRATRGKAGYQAH